MGYVGGVEGNVLWRAGCPIKVVNNVSGKKTYCRHRQCKESRDFYT